jgi:hypothetical protein
VFRVVAVGAMVALTAVPPLCAQEISGSRSTWEATSAVPSEPLRRSIAHEAARLAAGRVHAASAPTPSQPPRSWIGRHPVLTGALVGASAGAAWAALSCRGQCEGDARPYIALFGGAGAGIGAGIGGVIAAIRR